MRARSHTIYRTTHSTSCSTSIDLDGFSFSSNARIQPTHKIAFKCSHSNATLGQLEQSAPSSPARLPAIDLRPGRRCDNSGCGQRPVPRLDLHGLRQMETDPAGRQRGPIKALDCFHHEHRLHIAVAQKSLYVRLQFRFRRLPPQLHELSV